MEDDSTAGDVNCLTPLNEPQGKLKNMKISVWDSGLSESYLKQVTQLGADCIDFGNGGAFPGVSEQGYPDLDEVTENQETDPFLGTRHQSRDTP